MNESAELRQVLDSVARRFRQVRLSGALAICWLALAAVAGAALVLRPEPVRWGVPLALAAAAAVAWAIGIVVASRLSASDPLWVARRIETRHPELSKLLITAVEQQPLPGGRLGFLQASVVHKALIHRRSHDWDAAVSGRQLTAARAAQWTALAVLCGVLVTIVAQARRSPASDNATGEVATTIVPTGKAVEIKVDPGNTEIERGTALLVTATFPAAVPPEAALVVEGAEPITVRPMTRSLDDPTFAGHVPAVEADLSYRVEFPGGQSDTFRVKVFEYPQVKKVNARLMFPSFAGMEPKTIENVRHVSAVEGTELTLFFQLNKPVARAVLVDEKGQETPLTIGDPAKNTYQTTFTVANPQRFKVKLTDAEGRANKVPTEISVNVTRNQPPVVSVPKPGKDSRVSPLEELAMKADLKDDFGLVRYGLSIAPAGQPPKELVLQETGKTPVTKKAQPEHLLDFEGLKAKPDDVVAYFFWAEDLGPNGKPRRTSGDMYFAEVRHFEEIFRQGEQQAGGQEERERQQREQQEQQEQGEGNNAQRADQIAEMQKQIVNGTWKLIRREISSTPTPKFGEDSAVLREAQQSVIERAGQLAERLADPASVENLEQAVNFMKEADKQLGEAADKASIPALQPALSAGQAAYQALLKLRAREFEVTRNNRQQRQQQQRQQSARNSSNNSRSPSQNQLRQLELSDEQNRYETQSAARERQEQQAQREREQRENTQVANRLQELARRQTDLNERVKELQSSLEQARTDQQKEELQRQLKRLRDQQQQVLRDTDDLQEQLDQDQNRERMADAREQVEQTRERVRQASEALEEGRLSQAVTEGTRAERQLNQLRDELRRDSANRFGEEMRDIREQARKLDEDQKQLTRRLDEMKDNPDRSLQGASERQQVQQGLDQQRKQLDQVLDWMRRTVQEAEQPEPRLAQELFDTVQNTTERKVGDDLNLAQRLTGAGGVADAAEASRRSGQGIDQLRQGVEKAAESVLGGQTDALKRAQRELDELSNQLDREIAQATGQPDRQGNQAGQQGQRGQRGQQNGRETREGEQGQQGGQDGQEAREGRPAQQGQQGRRGRDGQQPGRQGQGERGQPGGQEGEQGDQPGQQPGQQGGGRQGQRGQQGQGGQRGQQGQRGGQQSGDQQGQETDAQQDGQGVGQPGQPGQRGQQPGQQGQGTGQRGQRGQQDQQPEGQPGEEADAQPGEQGGQPGQRGGRGGQGQRQGQPGNQGGRRDLVDRPGENQPEQQQDTPREGQPQGQPGGGRRGGGDDRLVGGPAGLGGPIRGEGYREWSDRLRAAEDLIEDPQLRAEAARIRDRARTAREDYKRHAKDPDWKKLQDLVSNPLNELRKRVAEEVRRRESPDALVPIDRDPVPPEFTDGVRRYYERLGSER